jgi:uncharacterized protein YlxP (DUF503 family)
MKAGARLKRPKTRPVNREVQLHSTGRKDLAIACESGFLCPAKRKEGRLIVSMIQMIFEIPEVDSIKEKRRIIRSVKDKLQRRFHLSAAEVDLQDSLSFAQIGGALVSNSRDFGETVLRKAFEMIEREVPVRIQDMSIHSEEF